ncbi:histidine triad nucleotide-binding protein [Alicyclobacillus fodiniaquatilis]|uniref:Histidine triad nucleotide-binding protein n=1 Tax=Alicyclobacillus fodiniaquatilis TaxID=1661150 RepID=A0ABW4JCL3_9BACL
MRVTDCLFCKIVAGEVPADKVFENDEVLAFHDIRPQAPVHVLLIPKKHIASAQDVTAEDAPLIGRLQAIVPEVAEKLGVAKQGYRLVTNIGWHGQQTVAHLHYHLVGGRQLAWPPG